MKDLTIFCGSSRCILCREPLHPCIGCHEARRCFCCGRCHTSYDEDVCAVYLENPEYWNKKMMDAYISKPYQGYRQYHPDDYSKPEGVYAYETEEEKKLAMLEASLSKLEQYLLAPNLSDEDRISCLVSKCQKLKMKIEIEERLSPLPVDIRDYSHMEEEVVEDNTTPMNPLSDEESLVDQMVCEDDEAEQSDEMNVCTEPLPISIIPINKCGEEGSRMKMKRVKLQDIGVYLVKWISDTRMCFLNMPIILTNLCRWHVNFRAFVGNVLGKCALRPP
ncbi:hypothetical protein HanIR_Chr12g0601071 [Helianthus annuus]|nr:hypothetical protein HanIR_Chr12g0601071 [Helianthus annuus]